MALGATRGRVSCMVATSAGWLVSVGFLLGAPTAFWSTRFAARSVENLPAGGAVPIASAAAALIAVAFIAVYVPAPRHTRRAGHRTTRGIGCAEVFSSGFTMVRIWLPISIANGGVVCSLAEPPQPCQWSAITSTWDREPRPDRYTYVACPRAAKTAFIGTRCHRRPSRVRRLTWFQLLSRASRSR